MQDERGSSVPLHCSKLFHTCPLCLRTSEVREDCRPNKVGGEDGKDVCTDEVDVDEGAVNCDVGVAAATGGEVAEQSHLWESPNQMVKMRQS